MIARPTTLKGKNTRQHLLAAARRVIKRDGFVAMRMIDVATEAEVSLGALYRYFKNKDDVFLDLIGDIHKDLFEASRAVHNELGKDPYATLLESNEGYLIHYFENRDIMRAFIEGTTVDARISDMWWWMRRRHVDRFVAALKRTHEITEIDGIPARIVVEGLASAVEQSAYVWYARESLNDGLIPVKTAAKVLAGIWYRAIWGGGLPQAADVLRPAPSQPKKLRGKARKEARDGDLS